MKRSLIIVACVVVLPVAAFLALFASAFAGTSAIREGDVAAGVHVVRAGFVTVDIIDVGGGHVALIDAGNDTQGRAIFRALANEGLSPNAVTDIFLTHGHPDHTSATHLFPSAKVHALAADVALAEGRAGSHGFITRLMPVKQVGCHVTQPLSDGEVVQVGSRSIHVFAVPGHTAGSAAYWVDGVLFLGDSAGSSTSGELLPAPVVSSDDPAQNRRSLKSLAARLHEQHLQVDVLVPAHSGWLNGIKPLEAFAEKM